MSDVSKHFEMEIGDLLDDRLSAVERRRVESHLVDCERCRAIRDALDRVRKAVRALPPAPASDALEREIVEGLRGASLRTEALRRAGVAALLAAAAILAVVVLLASHREDLPTAAANDFEQYTRGALSLELATSDPQLLEGYFLHRAVGFPTRVFDLSMMGDRLVGGRVHSIRGERSAFFVYHGPGNTTVVCEMFRGDTTRLPAAASRREHGGITFALYRRKGSTQVFWQEGEVACVLVSDLPPEETLALAFAKAMKATARSTVMIQPRRSDPS